MCCYNAELKSSASNWQKISSNHYDDNDKKLVFAKSFESSVFENSIKK